MAKKKVTEKVTEEKVVKEVVKRNVLSRNDISASVAEMNDVPKSEADATVAAIFETIQGALLEGNDVQIYGFGKFYVKDTAARMAHNPKTGEKIAVAASKRLGFKPSSTIKNAVKEV